VVPILGLELAALRTQAETLQNYAQRVSVELRQLRDTKAKAELQQEDVLRKIQDDNDRFVAQLIAEHDSAALNLRRERDAAIDRIRELSRGLSRIGAVSVPSMRRVSMTNVIATEQPNEDAAQLRARVEELLFERERSHKLLRQLAEQRDQAEVRLQAVLAAVDPLGARGGVASNRPLAQQASAHAVAASVAISEMHPNVEPPAPPAQLQTCEPVGADSCDRPHDHPFAALNRAGVEQTQALTDSAVVRTATPVTDSSESIDWDLSSPEKSPQLKSPLHPTHPDAPRARRTDADAPTPAGAAAESERTLPLLRKKTNPAIDRVGTYSIPTTELPVEEVVIMRSPGNVRQDR
jgi:hypothetical protein